MKNKITPDTFPTIELIEGKSKKDGDKPKFYWHIYSGGTHAGYVSISLVDLPVIGCHYSIRIFLNKKSQGKGIGRLGYGEACKRSGLKTVYAHMRKNNIASQKAAFAAGFREIKQEKFTQLLMIWHKPD